MASQNNRRYRWDPWGRLTDVIDDAMTWQAIYDPFGRRLQTHVTHDDNAPLITTSFYDPEEEFGEIGIQLEGNTFWKFCGPTSCDALTDQSGETVYLIHHMVHHLSAIVTSDSIISTTQHLNSYGPQTTPPEPCDLLSYAQTLTWQSKATDPTGFIWLGTRYYDPQTGRFLSPDPIGGFACIDLYTYANGDPINFTDLDGRFASRAYEKTKTGIINTWTDPRFQGALQVLGGIGETAVGLKAAVIGSAAGGVGGIPGLLIALHGIDQIKTGWDTFNSGAFQTSGTSQLLQTCGLPYAVADSIDGAFGFAGGFHRKALFRSGRWAAFSAGRISTQMPPVNQLPIQVHHSCTNKHKVFTPKLNKIVEKFGLKLNDSWNKEPMRHIGRHPNPYHQFVYKTTKEIAAEAKTQAAFKQLFEERVKKVIRENPDLLNKRGWVKK